MGDDMVNTFDVSPTEVARMKMFGTPRESRWGENPKLQCTLCLAHTGIAEWTDKLFLVNRHGHDVLVCETHKRGR